MTVDDGAEKENAYLPPVHSAYPFPHLAVLPAHAPEGGPRDAWSPLETRVICVQCRGYALTFGFEPQSHSRHQGVTHPPALYQRCPVSPSLKHYPRSSDLWAGGQWVRAAGRGHVSPAISQAH